MEHEKQEHFSFIPTDPTQTRTNQHQTPKNLNYNLNNNSNTLSKILLGIIPISILVLI